MLTFFKEGGFGMYPTLAFGLLLLAVGVAYALKPERKLLTLFTILGIVDFLSGSLGTVMGAVATFLYVSKLPAAQQYPTTLLGLAESLHNLTLALVFLVLSTLVLAAGALRAALAAGPERG
ncbi:MAG TPA: hypothetical protein VGK67_09870 [Myxococcales bacterium]|jgi:hypothetical protein